MDKKTLKTRLTELTPEELEKVNTQLMLVAETCEAHMAYMEDADEVTYDDMGLVVLEEAFLFLYQAWSEYLQEELTIRRGLH